MKTIILLGLLGVLCNKQQLCQAVLVRQSLHEYDNAMCSDGSAAAYYSDPTISNDVTRYVIYLRGGGYCHRPDVCAFRCSIAPHMCTTWKSQWKSQNGILSSDPAINPHFYSYYKVEVPYCSADMFAGNRAASPADGTPHFQGRAIIDAVISSLKTHTAIAQAAEVILAGGSAGGAGVVFNCQHLRHLLPGVTVRCIVDSAFLQPSFTPHHSRDAQTTCSDDLLDVVLKQGTAMWNATQEAMTFNLQSWWHDIQGPIFIVSAAVDRFAFENACAQLSSDDVTSWKRGIAEVVMQVARRPEVSYFVPDCFHHMMLTDESVFTTLSAGITLSDALAAWSRGITIHAPQPSRLVVQGNVTSLHLCG